MEARQSGHQKGWSGPGQCEHTHGGPECALGCVGLLLHVAERLARDCTVTWASLGRPVEGEPGLPLSPKVSWCEAVGAVA